MGDAGGLIAQGSAFAVAVGLIVTLLRMRSGEMQDMRREQRRQGREHRTCQRQLAMLVMIATQNGWQFPPDFWVEAPEDE